MHSVSIIINTLDRAQLLIGAIEGCLRQTVPAHEIIVVNGPSRDDTAAVLAQFGGRIRVLDVAEANLGISRNVGVVNATGSIVAFVDDDAVPEVDWIEQLLPGYAGGAVGAVGGFVIDARSGEFQWRVCTCARSGDVNTDTKGELLDFCLPGADPFLYLAGCNMSFRREAVLAVGGFDESLEYGYDDAELCLRLIDSGYAIAIRPTALVRHKPAANFVRDATMMIRDPFRSLAAHATFVTRNARERGVPADPDAVIQRQLAQIKAHGRDLAQQELLTEQELTVFLSRAEAGVAEGRSLGQRARRNLSGAIDGNRAASPSVAYTPAFFDGQMSGSLRSARRTLSHVLPVLRPASVVDIGCGTGSWLRAASESGTSTLLGLDGDYVPRERLVIPHALFRSTDIASADFARDAIVNGRFELAICMEVAEHLEIERASAFVSELVKLSDVILFSAAVPGQGGTSHLNEQWPEYWRQLFQQHDYVCFDGLRDRLWEDEDIEWWYAQNAFIFARAGSRSTQSLASRFAVVDRAVARVHPRALTFLTADRDRRLTELTCAIDALPHGADPQYRPSSLAEAQSIINVLRRDVDQLRRELAAMQNSRSWRITAPMRQLVGSIARVVNPS